MERDKADEDKYWSNAKKVYLIITDLKEPKQTQQHQKELYTMTPYLTPQTRSLHKHYLLEGDRGVGLVPGVPALPPSDGVWLAPQEVQLLGEGLGHGGGKARGVGGEVGEGAWHHVHVGALRDAELLAERM